MYSIKEVSRFVEQRECGEFICIDLIHSLANLLRNIDKAYFIYRNNYYKGYELCVKKFSELKEKLVYREKLEYPIYFTSASTKEEFLENMKALDGIELESYFKSNGWIISDTDLAICISQKYIETLF